VVLIRDFETEVLAQYGYRKSTPPPVGLLRLNTLRGTKAVLLFPERYSKHPSPINMGDPIWDIS